MLNPFTMRSPLFLLLLFCSWSARGQEQLSQLFDSLPGGHLPVIATFKSDHIINAQSNETLHQHDLVLAITHRFDDIAGSYGGVQTLFGLDNSTDIKIGFDYGITDRLMAGIARAKGAPETRLSGVPFNSLRQLWALKLKYKLFLQTNDNALPFSVTLFSQALVSSMPAVDDPTSDSHFQAFGDRWGWVFQSILARKCNDHLSLALLPTYIGRNRTAYGDMHHLFALGLGGRLRLTKSMALLWDGFWPFRSRRSRDYFSSKGIRFYPPLAIGWEIQTGGHVFHLVFTNATAIMEEQFIPYTTRSWGKGAFRWGFTITRTFTLSR